MSCCNRSARMGGPASIPTWTVVQGDTVVRTLSHAEALVELRTLNATDPSTPAIIYEPGAYSA